jgi:GntR family transcriptional regulator
MVASAGSIGRGNGRRRGTVREHDAVPGSPGPSGRLKDAAAARRGKAARRSRRWTDAAIRSDTGIPLYVQIRNLLKEQIRLGEWSAEDPMPTEDQLGAHFGVSRTTVRQAMTDLEREGLVVRKAGRGTFARQPLMVLRMQQMHSFAADLERRGLRSSRLTISVEKLDAAAEIAHRASEFSEREVVHLRQVRYADGVAVVVFDHYFPYDLCSFFLAMPLDDPEFSVQRTLEEHGIVLSRAKGEISATSASKLEAKYLDVEPGTPLVEIATKSYNSDDRVIEYSKAVVRTDRYPLALYSDWSGGSYRVPRQPEAPADGSALDD